MKVQKLTDIIEYFPASGEPLSADVGIVHGEAFDWLFDVGDSAEAVEAIRQISREKNVVLSHFHKDHTGNLDKITYKMLYCGAYTARKFRAGTPVTAPITLHDGVELTLFPIPSTHAKGSLGLMVNGEYAFVGDALYGAEKDGRTVYNVSLLHETIATLKRLPAQTLLVSHWPGMARPKQEIVERLQEVYCTRAPGQAYLELPEEAL